MTVKSIYGFWASADFLFSGGGNFQLGEELVVPIFHQETF